MAVIPNVVAGLGSLVDGILSVGSNQNGHALMAALNHAHEEQGDEAARQTVQQQVAQQAAQQSQSGNPPAAANAQAATTQTSTVQTFTAQTSTAPAAPTQSESPATSPANPGSGNQATATPQPGSGSTTNMPLGPAAQPLAQPAGTNGSHGGPTAHTPLASTGGVADSTAPAGSLANPAGGNTPSAATSSLVAMPTGVASGAPAPTWVDIIAPAVSPMVAPHASSASDAFAPAAPQLPAPIAPGSAAATPWLPEPASERALADTLVARRSAAIAAAFRVGGELEGARELRARTRELPPALAAEVVIAARPTLEGIVRASHRDPGDRVTAVERVHRGDGASSGASMDQASATSTAAASRQGQVAADIAGTIAHVARDPAGQGLARDTAIMILEAEARSEYRLSSYSLGIPFGTGITLPLALADELGRRGDRNRQRQLLVAMEQGLRQLGDRAASVVNGLLALTLPLLAAGEDREAEEGGGAAVDRIRAYANDNPPFLAEFTGAMQRLDAVGRDAFFALDTLSRRAVPQELCGARDHLLTDAKTAFAMSQSPSAQEIVVARSATSDGHGQTDIAAVRIESVQRVYRVLGFSPARVGLLAHATCTWHSTVLIEARWMTVRTAPVLDESARVFAALLRFVNAGPRPPIRAVTLADVDAADESADGLGLFHSLERAA